MAFEQTTLFPLAGLDGTRAAEYYEVMALVDQLSYAGNEAARRYINGQIDAAAATAWLERYALMPHDRAAQRVRFFDQYRSYVINYNYGKDLVRTLHRVARRHAGPRRSPLAGVREAAVVAAPALRPAVNAARRAGRARRCWRACLCLAGYVYAYTAGRAGTPIRSDAFSYYVYLPAWFLHHDPSLAAVADDCCGGEFPAWTAIIRWPVTHHWVNAHPIGEAILIAPFFAVAHALTRWTNLSPDGFTLYYQHAAGLAGLCYVIAGLWFLRRLLVRHFSVACRGRHAGGAALRHQPLSLRDVRQPVEPRLLVRAAARRCSSGSTRGGRRKRTRIGDAIVIGALAGLLMLVRHTNVLVPLCFVAAAALPPSRADHAGHGRARDGAAALALPPRDRTWLVSSYGQLGFTFAHPHLWGVLGSVTKGAFFWSPLLLVAVAGFAWLPASLRRWRLAIAVVLAVHTYVIASWWDWQFGASYGHRGFVDVYPLLALGLASAFARAALVPRASRRAGGGGGDAVRALDLSDAAVLARRHADGRHHLAAVPRRLPPRLVVTRRIAIAVVLVALAARPGTCAIRRGSSTRRPG